MISKNLNLFKILVVDDHMLSRKLLALQLVNYGFQEDHVVPISNPKEALENFENNDYDIVLADWDMPEMNGLEFVIKCKEIEKKKTAYIMISAEAQSEKILFAINSGVTSYITKPVSQNDINEKVAQVLSWIEEKDN